MPWWKRWGITLLVFLYGLLGVLYSLSVPLFEAPDEIWHYSFIHVMARDRAFPVQPTGEKDVWLREAGQPPIYHIVGAVVTSFFDTSDFPGFVRFNDVHPALSPGSESTAPNVFIHTHYEDFLYRGSVLVVHMLRLLGVLWGCGTIVGVYWVGREILSDVGLALAASALVAFNPHFIFISSVLNNDIAGACLCTWGLYLCIRLVRHPARLRTSLVLGIVLGLALLSKMSALALLALVAMALGLAWLQDRDWRAFLLRSGIVGGLALAVAGWWYVRNWVLYGDPLGWSIWLQDIGVQRIPLDELIRQFGDVFVSYWEPVAGLFPAPVFWFLGVLLILAAAGWGRMLARAVSSRMSSITGQDSTHGLLLAGTWFVLLFASLIRYMTTTPSAAGRLLYPGVASLAVWMVVGWRELLPVRLPQSSLKTEMSSRGDLSTLAPRCGCSAGGDLALCPRDSHLHSRAAQVSTLGPKGARPLRMTGPCDAVAPVAWGLVVGALLALSVATPILGIIPLYARPVERSVQAQLPMDKRFGEIELVGIDVTPDRVDQGDTVSVSLYWRVLAPPPQDLRVVVRLWALGGRMLGQRDQVPAGEVYPPDLWRTDEIVRDTYRVEVSGAGPARCRAMVSVQAGGTALGEITTPDLCTVSPAPLGTAMLPGGPSYQLGDTIQLVGYRLESDDPSVLMATLYWQVSGPVEHDYTIFVHGMDGSSQRVAHKDDPPLGGDYPTSAWRAGEILADVHTIPFADGIPADGYLLVGLYRLEDGLRLPAHTEAGERLPDDAIRIELRDVVH